MKKVLHFFKLLLPKNINIFSNNTTIKNVKNSEIILDNSYHKGDLVNKTVPFSTLDLKISDFTFNVNLNEDLYYEERLLRNNYQITDEDSLKSFFEEREIGQNVNEILQTENRIVILGNPGIGKTVELNHLFIYFWKEKEKKGIIPFYLNIKNFTDNTDIENLINFPNWRLIENPCFIIDGLDEISNLNNFISKLELFLTYNKKVKIILSCRTNIYEKFMINISESKHYFLEPLTDKQINNILKRNFSVEINIEVLNKFRVFLENPFTLNLFGSYYQENGRFPNTVSEAFELSIQKELNLTKEKFKNRITIDIPFVKKDLMKVAFVNELMQQNQINEDYLSELIERDYKPVFEELPFLDKLPHSANFVFRHKNYQEFFAAKFLSEKEADEIISIIKINDEINKTKPSLFNTITFLLNILDEDKFKKIKEWLLDNEPEILFLTEKDRIPRETQKEIFRKYFTDISFEKTFWFGRNRRFSMEKMADFADIDFLLDVIRKKEHFRAVYSAVDILNYIDDTEKEDEIKNLITELIFKDKEYCKEALRTFKERNYHIKEKKLFYEVTEFFKNDLNPDLNHQIISMLADFDNIDEYFDILKICLKNLYEIKPERIEDNTIRGTEWILEKLFLNINKPEHLIEIIKILYNPNYNLKFDNFFNKDFEKKLQRKIKSFVNNEPKIIVSIIQAVFPLDDFIFYKDDFLIKIINENNSHEIVFQFLLENYGINSNTSHALSLLFTEKKLNYFIDKFKNDDLKLNDNYNLESFRNHLSHYNFVLAKKLEKELIINGYKFRELIITDEERVINNIKYKNFVQENFEILFNKVKLKEEIIKIFNENKVQEMSWSKIHDIIWKWYDITHFHGIQNSVFGFIQNRVRNHDKTKEQILSYVDLDINLIYEIKNKIKNRRSEGFEVKPEHIEYIKKQSIIASENFDYDNVLKIESEDRTIFKNGYHILKMLYFFDKEYNINYKKEFYLQTLRYCNIHGSAEDNFEFIFERVNDKQIFDKTIVHNINSEQLDYSSLNNHIDYAIENKLHDTYYKIEDFIINNNYIFGNKEFLKRFTDLLPSNDKLRFLKKCCENPNEYLCWQAVKLMKEKSIGKDFLHKLAKDYIESGDENYFSNALDLLFYLNDLEALDVYLKFLRKFSVNATDLSDDFLLNTSNFQNFEKLNLLKEIFDIIYDEKNKGTFDYHHSKVNLENLISNLSYTKEGYNAVQKIIKEIKIVINNKESKFFYINHLIDLSEQTYYNSLAKPLTFHQAKDFLTKL